MTQNEDSLKPEYSVSMRIERLDVIWKIAQKPCCSSETVAFRDLVTVVSIFFQKLCSGLHLLQRKVQKDSGDATNPVASCLKTCNNSLKRKSMKTCVTVNPNETQTFEFEFRFVWMVTC